VSSSDIPDTISAEALSSLLRGRNPMPLSDVIPALDFGGENGAPCDLQFAICQLIERSEHGINIIQMLVSAMHLLSEVESHFERHMESLAREHAPYDQLTAGEQQTLARVMREHLMYLKVSLKHLEDVLTPVGYPYYAMRSKELIAGPLADKQLDLREFRSYLLISDELIKSLGLERSALTTYLDSATKTPDTPSNS
jgi:hypothetical protein